MNAPQTFEGAQVWDLILRLGGQFRIAGTRVVGLDMGAALAMARALGVPGAVVAEILPAVEPVIVRAVNEQIGEQHGRETG